MKMCNYICWKKFFVLLIAAHQAMPDPHNHDRVTNFAIVSPVNLLPSDQLNLNSSYSLCSNSAAYHMATICAGGNVKLWRSIPSKSSTAEPVPEDLPVGMFSVHQGPVRLCASGQKIASISRVDPSEKCQISVCILYQKDQCAPLG